jgi:sugar lactone lactonase YvrE
VDPAGRLWTGSLDDGEVDPVGRLYCLDTDLQVKTMDSGFVCSNGIDWSPYASWMYFVDSQRQTIYRYSYDVATGKIDNRETFVDTSSMEGIPDGICVDVYGKVWCAFWDGAAIHAFDSSGKLVNTVPVPVLRPTSITFGGSDMTTMFVTSATNGLTNQQIEKWPLSGSVLAIQGQGSAPRPNVFGGQRKVRA